MRKRCSIDGCDRPHVARGFCANHYQVWRAGGTPTPEFEKPVRDALDRLMRRVEKTETCWLWTGAQSAAGYGDCVGLDGRNVNAMRAVWELLHGAIPPRLSVMHLCDNRMCVRPDHLVLGTQAANYLDMVQKGRASWQTSPRKPKTECPHGHPMTGDNVRADINGKVRCRACGNERDRERRRKKKEGQQESCPACGVVLRRLSNERKHHEQRCPARTQPKDGGKP